MDLKELIAKHEKVIRICHAGSEVEQIEQIVTHYQDIAAKTLVGSQQFRDDLLVTLRALSMIATMTGNAGTHSEKAARLRGMIELIESMSATLRDMDFNYQYSRWQFLDVFASNYPAMPYISRIKEQEREIEFLREQLEDVQSNKETKEAGH